MTPHFDLVDLRLFANIAATNSVTRGAERSNMSAPSASVRIRNLEIKLGAKLLDRSSHGVTLTPAGQTFLHHARVVLEQLETLQSDLSGYAKGVKGHIRIAASAPAVAEFLPGTLRTYRTVHPEVNVDLRERYSNEVIRAVSDGTADIGIVGGPLRTESLEVLPYLEDRLALVTPVGHPLADRGTVHFAQALAYEIIGLPEGSAVFNFVRSVADTEQASSRVSVLVRSYEALCHMVEAGIGVGVMSERSAHRYARINAIKVVPLADPAAARDLQICVRKLRDLSPFARDFVDLLRAGRDRKACAGAGNERWTIAGATGS